MKEMIREGKVIRFNVVVELVSECDFFGQHLDLVDFVQENGLKISSHRENPEGPVFETIISGKIDSDAARRFWETDKPINIEIKLIRSDNPKATSYFKEAADNPDIILGFDGHARAGKGLEVGGQTIPPEWFGSLSKDQQRFMLLYTCNSMENYWIPVMQYNPNIEGIFTTDITKQDLPFSWVIQDMLTGADWEQLEWLRNARTSNPKVNPRISSDALHSKFDDSDNDGLPDAIDSKYDPEHTLKAADVDMTRKLSFANQKVIYYLREEILGEKVELPDMFYRSNPVINDKLKVPVDIDWDHFRIQVRPDVLATLDKVTLAAVMYFEVYKKWHGTYRTSDNDHEIAAKALAGSLAILKKFNAYSEGNTRKFCRMTGLVFSHELYVFFKDVDYYDLQPIAKETPVPDAIIEKIREWVEKK